MIDTNIYDFLLANPAVRAHCKELRAQGKMKFLTTQIQRDEIARTPDAAKREALQQINEPSAVASSGFVWDLSPWDQSEWPSTEDENLISLVAITEGFPGALIALTAKNQTDVLVTNDTKLRKALARINAPLTVWTPEDFVAWVRAQ